MNMLHSMVNPRVVYMSILNAIQIGMVETWPSRMKFVRRSEQAGI